MVQREEALMRRLLQEDEEFKTIKAKHAALEELLQQFETKPWLTPQDELEIKRIKKKKLLFKDEMQKILASHRAAR
jgi:uncharacterized protein YdcH (DUF465 family)